MAEAGPPIPSAAVARPRLDDPGRLTVATAADFDTLDQADIRDGYGEGSQGRPCASDRSRSFWHGWKSGRCAAGYAEPDVDALRLARDIVQRERIERAFAAGYRP